ncbi:MAG TPA: tripartite tricarboxylate transporter substrate binding protein [Ramlibacter sp.]|nr:tripartite tricarboxylate transporter substrate binding protein [Ramlibacter sp.]
MDRRQLLALGGASLAALARPLHAQAAWPSRPITAIVPFAPGGAGNGSLRILAEVMGPKLGQPIVVDNRPGGGGIPGTRLVARSNEDHMLLMGSTSMTIAPALNHELGYDVQRDLQPVGMISSQPVVLAVAANSPISSLADLIGRGRAQEITVGNSGVGTLSHLATALLNSKLGTRFQPIPYKGDAVLIPDVVSGNVAVGVFNLPVAMPMIQAGRLRALAVTSATPMASLPSVPLLKTLGDDLVITGWAALFASKAVPQAGIERFAAALRQALADPGVRERFAAFGVAPESSTPAQLRDFMSAEITRWGDVIRAQGIKTE